MNQSSIVPRSERKIGILEKNYKIYIFLKIKKNIGHEKLRFYSRVCLPSIVGARQFGSCCST